MAADADLRAELLALAEGVRARGGETPPADAERLWAILDDSECWPGRRLVDDAGAAAAWILAQHARSDPGLQHRCLELLEVAVAWGDAGPEHYAFLYDCVRMADGKDQLYGSQFVRSVDGDTVVPWPIEDPEHAATMRAQFARRFG